jgi:hypothetical protein
MAKYFLKVSFTLLFLTLLKNIVFAEVKLVSPYNGEVLEDRVVHFKWENTDPDTEYVYQHVRHLNGELNNVRIAHSTGSEEELLWGLVNNQIYFWEVKYHPKESFDGVYDYETDIFVLGINQEIPDYAWELLGEYNKTEEEAEEKDEEVEEVGDKIEVTETKEEIEEIISLTEPEQVKEEQVEEERSLEKKKKKPRSIPEIKRSLPIKIPIKTTPTKPKVQEEDYNWNIKNSSVLGVSKSKNEEEKNIICRFKYYKKDHSFEKVFCKNPDINILKEKLYPFSNEYSLSLEGNIGRNINIQVDTYLCVPDIFKPKTWFKCNEEYLESEVITIRPHLYFRVKQNGLNIPVRSFSMNGDHFKLVAGYMTKKDNLKVIHTYRIINSKYDIFHDHKTELIVDLEDLSDNTSQEGVPKPFGFPFNKIIGVTQWYGFTDYQSPHTGIDFGATREKVTSGGEGEVVAKGWDNYYGKCLSGGNFLKIKHPNGMHTTYFHLEDMYVNTGDLVKKGQIIGKSGNTGAWNCQELAYHLHFETRLNSSYKSHTNPVPYINVDWNKVSTLGAKYNPGRLSGENPHPGR